MEINWFQLAFGFWLGAITVLLIETFIVHF